MDRGAIRGSFTQTARQQAAATLAFFAILLHIALPTLYDIAPPNVQGMMDMTICSGGEAVQIVVDDSGKPVKQVPASNHQCHGCLSHCGTLALASVALVLPQLASLHIAPLAAALPHGSFAVHTRARAPPL
ncbi:MAG: DUF2946 family protein [Parvibaculaceae bacterium]